MKDKINTYVQLYLNDIELNISVTKDLKAQEGNFGFFEITDGSLDTKPIFWDNILWVEEVGKKEFKKDMKEELSERGYDWIKVRKDCLKLLNRARKLKILN